MQGKGKTNAHETGSEDMKMNMNINGGVMGGMNGIVVVEKWGWGGEYDRSILNTGIKGDNETQFKKLQERWKRWVGKGITKSSRGGE